MSRSSLSVLSCLLRGATLCQQFSEFESYRVISSLDVRNWSAAAQHWPNSFPPNLFLSLIIRVKPKVWIRPSWFQTSNSILKNNQSQVIVRLSSVHNHNVVFQHKPHPFCLTFSPPFTLSGGTRRYESAVTSTDNLITSKRCWLLITEEWLPSTKQTVFPIARSFVGYVERNSTFRVVCHHLTSRLSIPARLSMPASLLTVAAICVANS